MIWSRLKTMRCPKCNGFITGSHGQDNIGTYSCTACDFWISALRFDEVVNKLYTSHKVFRPDEMEENQRRLNEL